MKRSRGGFTLIEMVAAVAASAFVFAAGTILVVSSMRMQKQILSDASRVSDARVVLTMIENLASDGAIAPPVHNDDDITIYNTGGTPVISYKDTNIYAGAGTSTDTPLMEDVKNFTATVDGLLLKVEITDSNDETFSTSVYCRSWAPELSEIKDSLDNVAIMTEKDSRYNLISTAFGQLGSSGTFVNDQGVNETFLHWFNNNWNSGGAWCGCFVSWCIEKQENTLNNPPKLAEVTDFVDYFITAGRYVSTYNTVIPGDLIFFDTNNDLKADHMGIVLKVDTENKIVCTIEGNRHKQVAFETYELTDPIIIGYGQLDWN